MRVQKMLVYRQNNSGGYFKEVKHLLKDDLTVIPCDFLFHSSLLEGAYVNVAIKKGTKRPKVIYFDGVERGVDCGHCGDRWSKSDGVTEVDVYIFKTKDDLKQAKEDGIIPMYSAYSVLEDLR